MQHNRKAAMTRRIHPAWLVALAAFIALMGAAAFRAAPGPLMIPLNDEFGWPIGVMSTAVSLNILLYGLTAPFAAALIGRFGIRRVTSFALVMIAAGSGLTVFVTAEWVLFLTWGVLIGVGTGSMALVFASEIAGRWFVKRRGLVVGILSAGSATGQLVFLPLVASLAETTGWRVASVVIAATALAVVPLVLVFIRNDPSELGVGPYGVDAADYDQRCACALAQGLGLWDVYASCEREGSLDSAIRAAELNDFAGLLRRCPELSGIAHNGGESFRHARAVQQSLQEAGLGARVRLHRLPSTSPANASWSFERKLGAWRQLMLEHGL